MTTVVVSWWGRGSIEDARLPHLESAAARHHLQLAVHIEPYANRSVETVAADLAHLRSLGIRDVYVYDSSALPDQDWATLNGLVDDMRLFANTRLPGKAKAGGFDGLYTYDVLLYDGDLFPACAHGAQARRLGLLCAPSVGPGYDARNATPDRRIRPRRRGATYDSMWRGAISVRRRGHDHELQRVARGDADRARAPRRATATSSYDGAWGPERRGRAAGVPRADGVLVVPVPRRPARRDHPRTSGAAAGDERVRTSASVDARSDGWSRSTSTSARSRAPAQRALVGAVAEQPLGAEHPAATGLAPGDALDLAQLLERVDAHVRVGADAERDARGARCARRAGSRRRGSPPWSGRRRSRARLGEQVELRAVRRASRGRPSCAGRGSRFGRAARSAGSRARRGTPRSRAAARRRARAAAAVLGGVARRSPRASPRGQARTEWGATPTRSPSSRSVSTWRR